MSKRIENVWAWVHFEGTLQAEIKSLDSDATVASAGYQTPMNVHPRRPASGHHTVSGMRDMLNGVLCKITPEGPTNSFLQDYPSITGQYPLAI